MDLDFTKPDYTPEQMAQYLTDFVCDQYHLADTYKCTHFMDILHRYDYVMDYHFAHDRVSPTEQEIAAAGLVLMFNSKWLVEPAFVNWNEMKYCVYEIDTYSLRDVFVLDKFIEKIEDPKLKMTIIKHLLKFYYPKNKDLVLLMERERIAANGSTPAPSSSAAPNDSSEKNFSSVSPESHSELPLFKYIHVAVTDDKERKQIHKMVCNIVRLPKMQQVCDELYKLMKNGKVLCTINPDSMLAELRRLGLPAADKTGFSDANFFHYYRAPKLD